MDDRPNPSAARPSSEGADAPAGHAAGARHPQPSRRTLDTAAQPPAPLPRRPGRPWGFWATVGWTVLLLVAWYVLRVVIPVVAGIVFAVAGAVTGVSAEELIRGPYGGTINVAATAVVAAIMLVLIVLLSVVRRVRVRDYLALTRPAPKETFGWLMAALAVVAVTDVVYRLAGVNPVTDFELTLYTSTPVIVLLFALTVLAPVLEETWWRGFVYRGIAASKAGPVAAVVLPAVPFTLMHTQYAWVHLPAIFVIGVTLGVVRWQSGSTVLAMICHAAVNVFYFASIVVEVHWLGRTAAGP